jgi:CheY-like chemotaxis protein
MLSAAPSPALDTNTLASILHELRGPLSALIAHSEMLTEGLHGPMTAPQRGAVLSMQQQARETLGLLDNLAEVWLGRPPAPVPFADAVDLDGACRKALQQNQALLHERSTVVRIHLEMPAAASSADAAALGHPLVELIACGILLLPKDSQVCLTVTARETSLTASLGDDCSQGSQDKDILAIALEQLGRIKPIGLQLLEHRVAQWGGQLFARRVFSGYPGLGMVLPLPHATPSQPHAEAPSFLHETVSSHEGQETPPLENRPLVLMADDQVALTTVASHYLEELGMRVLLASDGLEALRLAFEHHPDLIIIDVRMPLLDGLQVVQQLRSCDNPRLAQVPVICISGYSGPVEEDRCIASGATRFLKKPFGLPQLEELLHEYLPKTS